MTNELREKFIDAFHKIYKKLKWNKNTILDKFSTKCVFDGDEYAIELRCDWINEINSYCLYLDNEIIYNSAYKKINIKEMYEWVNEQYKNELNSKDTIKINKLLEHFETL